jgi:hypothetical protein
MSLAILLNNAVMFTKLIYVLFFGLANFIIYTKLNKTGKINAKLFWSFIAIFLLFVFLYIDLFYAGFLMKWKDFFPFLLLLIVPVVVYYWFTYLAIKRITRLKDQNERFFNFGIKIFSFFFLEILLCNCFYSSMHICFQPLKFTSVSGVYM